jgi:hypothetical protein
MELITSLIKVIEEKYKKSFEFSRRIFLSLILWGKKFPTS